MQEKEMLDEEKVMTYRIAPNGDVRKAIKLLGELIVKESDNPFVLIRQRRIAFIADILFALNNYEKIPKEGLQLVSELIEI